MPSADCRTVGVGTPFGWAVGGGNQYFPSLAGYPIGGDTEYTYAFMEMHYDVCCLCCVNSMKSVSVLVTREIAIIFPYKLIVLES